MFASSRRLPRPRRRPRRASVLPARPRAPPPFPTPAPHTHKRAQERPDLDGPLTVIDFEYGGYGRRGFDLGNHFNEYAGFECDYGR